MPYHVSWQSVSMKSQRPVHVLASAARASTPQHAPAAARIVAATELCHGSPPCLDVDDPDWENDDYKTHYQPSRKISIVVAAAPQRFCTAWRFAALRSVAIGTKRISRHLCCLAAFGGKADRA